MKLFCLFVCFICLVTGLFARSSSAMFMPNKGQVHSMDGKPLPAILYSLNADNISVALGKNFIHYTFFKHADTGKVEVCGLDMVLLGANPSPGISAQQEQAYYENYYTLGCGENGITNVHGYKKIVYQNIYPSIDWVVYIAEGSGSVKYDFIVHAGGAAANIRMSYQGGAVKLNAGGSITTSGPLGSVTEEAPFAYMRTTGRQVKCNYILHGNEVKYNAQKVEGELVIDPGIAWATYYGGPGSEWSQSISYGGNGDLYTVGFTYSGTGISTPGSYQPAMYGTQISEFIARFDTAGQRVWATYYSGATYTIADQLFAVANDNAGNIYVAGATQNTGAPGSASIISAGAHQSAYGGGFSDGILLKFSSAGIRIWSTYYGGEAADIADAIACDNAGNVYAAGWTASTTNIATPGSFQPTAVAADTNGFIAKFSSAGARQWGTYYGGPYGDFVNGIACDGNNDVYIVGSTLSHTGLATPGSHQQANGGGRDGFFAKFSSAGSQYWSTYYGGPSAEMVSSVACDANGAVYISGNTFSGAGIATSGTYQSSPAGGNGDAFIAKFNGNGQRSWGSYFGGPGDENPGYMFYTVAASVGSRATVSCTNAGAIYLCGTTRSTSGIASPGSYQAAFGGGISDGFVAQFAGSGSLLWASYLGGDGNDDLFDVANDGLGNIYVTGRGNSTVGISTPGAWQAGLSGGYDVILARFRDSSGTGKILLHGPLPGVCAVDTFSVAYTLAGTFYAGNVFTAQLSNIAGSFVNPTTVGSVTSFVAGSILCFSPVTPAGTYKLRVVSSAPVRISDTVLLTINALPQPVITRAGSVLSTGSFASYQWVKDLVDITGATNQSYTLTQNGNYKVKVTSANGCENTSAAYTVQDLSGITAGNVADAIKIYPNPASGQVFIQSPSPVSCIITNMQGQIVLQKEQVNEIDISLLPNSVYTVSVFKDNIKLKTEKLVKMQ